MFDWRATPEESREELPGDDWLPEVEGGSTYAITMRASRERVWPWLLQMGCDRAGFYSYDRLDNGGRPSAEHIVPEFQDVKLGDVLPSRPGSPHGFEVLRLDPPEFLLLGAYLRVPGFTGMPWGDPRPPRYLRSTWTFVLREPEPGATRLVVRSRGVVRPRWFGLALNSFMNPAHVVMQRKQLLNLRRRAEVQGSLAAPGA